jgi:hypothetical protein
MVLARWCGGPGRRRRGRAVAWEGQGPAVWRWARDRWSLGAGCGVRVRRGWAGAWPCTRGRSVRGGKRWGCGSHLKGGLSWLQAVLQPGREHALPGWVGDSESMGGRAIGAGGGLCLQGPEEGAMLGGKVPESYRNLPRATLKRRGRPTKTTYGLGIKAFWQDPK